MEIQAQENQSILDVTVQAYGNIEELVQVVFDNDLSLANSLPTGKKLIVNPNNEGDQEVKSFYTRNNTIPNNAERQDTGLTNGAFQSKAFTDGFKIGT